HRVGALERRAVGELQRDDEIALVLRRDEPRRNRSEADDRENQERDIRAERGSRSMHEAAQSASVAMAGALERAIERAEERPENPIPQASKPILLGAVRLEKQRTHRRAQGERIERRQDRRDRDGQRELTIELPGDTAEE